jgi:hypothetical protein
MSPNLKRQILRMMRMHEQRIRALERLAGVEHRKADVEAAEDRLRRAMAVRGDGEKNAEV